MLGTTPLLLGNIEQWPAIHVFGPTQGALVPADQVQKLGFGNAGASWTSAENVEAAQTLSTWAEDGYFNKGVNGTDYDAAWQKLTKGDGAFLLGGSWLAADLQDAMGDDVGFFTPPAKSGEGADTTGGTVFRLREPTHPSSLTRPRNTQPHHERRRNGGPGQDRKPSGCEDTEVRTEERGAA